MVWRYAKKDNEQNPILNFQYPHSTVWKKHGKGKKKRNVFVKPNEQSQAMLELCHGEKTEVSTNVFDKPDE